MIGRQILWLSLIVIFCGNTNAEIIKKDGTDRYKSEMIANSNPMEPGGFLTINSAGSLSGSIEIETGGDKLIYRYQKLLKAETKSEAARFAKVITVVSEQTDRGITISLRAPATTPWAGTNNSGRLKLIITMPEGSSVRINSAYFDINGTGPFTEFIVTESLSRVEISQVTDLVDIKVSNRPLIVNQISGQIRLTNQYGPIKIKAVDCTGKTAVIRNNNGDITIQSYIGGLEVRSEMGRIIGKNLFLTGDQNYIKNKSADVILSFDSLTTGRLRINNRYGNINLKIAGRLDARFVCKTEEESEVTAQGMFISSPLVDKNRLEFETGEGTAEVRVTARGSGNIKLNGPERN